MIGAAVVENEFPYANEGRLKVLSPNENAVGLAIEKFMSEADVDSAVFGFAACNFSLADSKFSRCLTSANAVDTTRSPRKAA